MSAKYQDLEAAARALLDRIDRDEDARACYLALNATIEDFRRTGTDVPPPLVAAKRQLEFDLAAQSQGR